MIEISIPLIPILIAAGIGGGLVGFVMMFLFIRSFWKLYGVRERKRQEIINEWREMKKQEKIARDE